MSSPKLFKSLRIAWSVGWGVVAVLLVALWIRSYWRQDCFHIPPGKNNRMFAVASFSGILGIRDAPVSIYTHPWRLSTTVWREWPDHTVFGIYYKDEPQQWTLEVNDWLLVLSSVALASTPWFRLRFSLRTLLIATTLVAFVLYFFYVRPTRLAQLFIHEVEVAAQNDLQSVSAQYFDKVSTDGATLESMIYPRRWSDIFSGRQIFTICIVGPEKIVISKFSSVREPSQLIYVKDFTATPFSVSARPGVAIERLERR
jgi:hypothetical protein